LTQTNSRKFYIVGHPYLRAMARCLVACAALVHVATAEALDTNKIVHADHTDAGLTEVSLAPTGSMHSSSSAATYAQVMRREAHGIPHGTFHSAFVEQHVQANMSDDPPEVPSEGYGFVRGKNQKPTPNGAIKSCRHPTWKNDENPKRMTLGTYCVDTRQATADFEDNTITQAALDNCAHWEDATASGPFIPSTQDCTSSDGSMSKVNVVSCHHPTWKDDNNPKRMATGKYCVDLSKRTESDLGTMMGQAELNKCQQWGGNPGQVGAFVPDYVKNCMGEDQSNFISCGGHKATRCQLCTVIDPDTGLETNDRGPDWCHGDCTYYDQECHKVTVHNVNKERDASEEGATTSKHIPDILNPEITDEDHVTMDEAADRAIEEADYEAKQKQSNAVAREQEEKDKAGNFLLVAICSGSSVLALCAVVTFIMSCCFIWTGRKKGKDAAPLVPEAAAEAPAEAAK